MRMLLVASTACIAFAVLAALVFATLGANRLAGFSARHGERVRAYVGGAAWRGAVRDIPLHRHAEIVLELGAYIPPHSTYLFWRGL